MEVLQPSIKFIIQFGYFLSILKPESRFAEWEGNHDFKKKSWVRPRVQWLLVSISDGENLETVNLWTLNLNFSPRSQLLTQHLVTLLLLDSKLQIFKNLLQIELILIHITILFYSLKR